MVEEPLPLRWLIFLSVGLGALKYAKIGFYASREGFWFISDLEAARHKEKGCAESLHHISLEERQQKITGCLFGCTSKQIVLMPICSGGGKRTGPTHAGLGPSFEFKVKF